MAQRNLLAATWMLAFLVLVVLPMSALPIAEHPVLAMLLPVWCWLVKRAMQVAVRVLEPAAA